MSLKQIVVGVCVAIALTVAWVVACGPELTNFITTNDTEPANPESYSRGSLGVVRPPFARRYLVQAYRVLSGQPAIVVSTLGVQRDDAPPGQKSPLQEFFALSDSILNSSTNPDRAGQWLRLAGSYENFLNCPDAAYTLATKTLRARIERYGRSSTTVWDWTSAQVRVFRNCDGDTSLPSPARESADALARADRDYQTAAAYFYATQYDEAERRFRAIGQDKESPWQPYGRYMAARVLIRSATVIEENKSRAPELLAAAEQDLRAIIADSSAAQVHEWARQLLAFVALRLHPVERLHELSHVLATSGEVTRQDLDDYRWVFGQLLQVPTDQNTTDYLTARAKRRSEMRDGDDLTDWILALQGEGDDERDRALTRWQDTRKTHWLVAALWHVSPQDPAANSVLAAAGTVTSNSPAYATVAFLRVRLLVGLGRRAEAKAALATLPTAPARGFEQEAVNFITAERLLLADSLDEFLANVSRRTIVVETPWQPSFNQPVMDDDAAIVLNSRFPLNRLVDAAVSPSLPRRLRVRVASAAFARAVLLDREDAGLKVAPVLARLAPPLKANLDRYISAPSAQDRHVAGVFVLLETPGMRPTVLGIDDNYSSLVADPNTAFDGSLHRNGWCDLKADVSRPSRSALVVLMYGATYPEGRQSIPFPAFMTADERAATEREFQALVSVGTSRSYLGTEALNWARSAPKDPRVAEALAQTVTAWHLTQCSDGDGGIARQAFVNLHRLFPQSEAARRTKYWYK